MRTPIHGYSLKTKWARYGPWRASSKLESVYFRGSRNSRCVLVLRIENFDQEGIAFTPVTNMKGYGSCQQRRNADGVRLESLDRDAPEARCGRPERAASLQGDIPGGGERVPRPVACGKVRRQAGPLHERGGLGCSTHPVQGTMFETLCGYSRLFKPKCLPSASL